MHPPPDQQEEVGRWPSRRPSAVSTGGLRESSVSFLTSIVIHASWGSTARKGFSFPYLLEARFETLLKHMCLGASVLELHLQVFSLECCSLC